MNDAFLLPAAAMAPGCWRREHDAKVETEDGKLLVTLPHALSAVSLDLPPDFQSYKTTVKLAAAAKTQSAMVGITLLRARDSVDPHDRASFNIQAFRSSSLLSPIPSLWSLSLERAVQLRLEGRGWNTQFLIFLLEVSYEQGNKLRPGNGKTHEARTL
jgi:hypothetical protein